MRKAKTLNQDFFKTWTAGMAYVLGFFAADGNMIRNKRGAHFISFHITDRMILKEIRIAIGSDHKIAVRKPKKKTHKVGYRLQVGSKSMFADLTKIGFTPAKSTHMKFPDVPSKYFGDFVRGYFDGDGCVYFKRHVVSKRKNPKWIFSSRFTAGTRTFIDPLHAMLKSHGVRKGFVVSKKSGHTFELILSHRDSVALFHLMYDTMPVGAIYLRRKYLLFRKALWTLYKMRP